MRVARSGRGRGGRGGLWAAVLAAALMGGAARAEEAAGADETARLRRQVRYLAQSLGEARAQVEALKARLDRTTFDRAGGDGAGAAMGPAGIEDREYRVLEVNRELGMAVLNAGRRQGLRPGLEFAVMNRDRAVATLRTVDVRAAVAGAVVERVGGAYPKARDRVVLVSGSRE